MNILFKRGKKSFLRNEKDRYKVISKVTGKTIKIFRNKMVADSFAFKYTKEHFGDECEIVDTEYENPNNN